MRKMLKQVHNPDAYCPRKIAGMLCIAAGIVIILTKVVYFMCTGIQIPFEGRGQFLVGTGAGLLGITTVDGLIQNRQTKQE